MSMWTKESLQPCGLFVRDELPLVFPPFGDRKQWLVGKEFEYIDRRGNVIMVKKDEKTDLASIPRWLRFFFGANQRETIAAIIHDHGYNHQSVKVLNILTSEWVILTRAQWDGILHDVMRLSNTKRVRRWFIYHGVRVGGWYAWRKNRPA